MLTLLMLLLLLVSPMIGKISAAATPHVNLHQSVKLRVNAFKHDGLFSPFVTLNMGKFNMDTCVSPY
jgi:hypothetical protein